MVVNIRVLIILVVVGLFLLNKNASNSDVVYVKHSINNNTNSSSTNNEERLRMAMHIAFYQIPNSPREKEKFDSLHRVLKAVETYTDLYQVDIIIHTNELKDQPPLLTRVGYNCTLPYYEDQWQCPIVTVLQHNIQQLPHPHYLTWMHRPAMIEQMNSTKYDLYAYIEDDQIISRKNILYHQTYSKIAMEEEGCSLGFVRVIDKRYTNGTLYFQPNPQYGRTYLHSKKNTSSAQQWARIERDVTYWAGWMMEDGPALRAFSSSREFPYRTLYEFMKLDMIREIAAWGWGYYRYKNNHPLRAQCTLVPLVSNGEGDQLILHSGASTQHLGGKLISDDCKSGVRVRCGNDNWVKYSAPVSSHTIKGWS